MALDLYQLKAFWLFAKIRNFTKTAERLFVTQSAVSHALKKLEDSTGTPLIVRRIFLFREQYVVIAAPAFVKEHDLRKIDDLERVTILSMDETGEWWNNFIFAQADEHRTVLKNIVQINHVRGLINGALTGMGVSFVPRYTVENELREGRLRDVFPGGQLMDDHFCVYVKREKRGALKNKLMIDFLLERFSGFEAKMCET